jgi:hypothetical protein
LVGVTVNVSFDPARDNFGVTVVALGKLNQRGDQKGLVLHQAKHENSL